VKKYKKKGIVQVMPWCGWESEEGGIKVDGVSLNKNLKVLSNEETQSEDTAMAGW
jgi:hypothetical protein